MAENDGTFECGQCPPGRTPLNAEDRSCWRCGSLDIKDMRPAHNVEETWTAQLDALIANINAGWKP